jgi:hypothetical protein
MPANYEQLVPVLVSFNAPLLDHDDECLATFDLIGSTLTRIRRQAELASAMRRRDRLNEVNPVRGCIPFPYVW